MTWSVEDLTVAFGSTVALDSVTVRVEPGVVHAVIGGDGAGKSTLLRVMAGLGLDHGGTVNLPSQDRIGFVPSSGGVFGDLTVDENIEFVAAVHRLRSWRPRAAMLLERAGIASFGDRLASALSGGERRKLAGSMAVLAEPDLLILDEVTTGVDPVSRMELWRLIATTAAAGTAVLAATSYLDEAERATQVELLHNGRVLASGAPDDIIEAVRGTITDEDIPSVPANAWRHGRRWRQWHPDAPAADPGPSGMRRPSLEDAAIVFELAARRSAP
jgi:ABC-2 type transport system ATP-binding protein